ncbi:MAG: ribbon-helix-helix domain-containing protein [Ilumatobacteraceae bacterium]
MSTQIAVRLPDDVVAELDDQVRRGVVGNRTEFIRTVLTRELRRLAIEAELQILRQPCDDPDGLPALAAWAARQPIED